MKEIITTENAPAAVGTYSTAYKCGNMVFLSGQLGLDSVSGELPASFEAQCRQAFRNVFAIVKAAGRYSCRYRSPDRLPHRPEQLRCREQSNV